MLAATATGLPPETVEVGPMGEVRLPPRLAAVAEAVPPCGVVADVGTERAGLPIFLLLGGRCGRAIAIDRSKSAIAAARRALDSSGLSGQCELRLGDGLAPLRHGEADVIVVAGVGARLSVRMLRRDLARLIAGGRGPVLVLQPMSEPHLLRSWLESQRLPGLTIAAERLAEDAGRYYHVLVAVSQTEAKLGPPPPARLAELRRMAGDAAAQLGPYVLLGPDPLLPGYLDWRRRSLERLASRAEAGGTAGGQMRAAAARRVERALARIQDMLGRNGEVGWGG